MYIDQSILRKELYEAPSTSVVDVRFEGIICQSQGGLGAPNNYNNGGDPFGF